MQLVGPPFGLTGMQTIFGFGILPETGTIKRAWPMGRREEVGIVENFQRAELVAVVPRLIQRSPGPGRQRYGCAWDVKASFTSRNPGHLDRGISRPSASSRGDSPIRPGRPVPEAM